MATDLIVDLAWKYRRRPDHGCRGDFSVPSYLNRIERI